jgi:TATA-box binding protein (TBP) (component of TFIID and TFIIIB)
MNIEDEWKSFLMNQKLQIPKKLDPYKKVEEITTNELSDAPNVSELCISTKTKIVYLNTPLDVNVVFWNVPIIQYGEPSEGVVKKTLRMVFNNPQEVEHYENTRLTQLRESGAYFTEQIIQQVNTTKGKRHHFKDERKISIGVCRKDVVSSRCKEKRAFFNCFVSNIRFMFRGAFHEIHVKIFHTGKMEIPGILNKEMFMAVQEMILKILRNALTINGTDASKLGFLDHGEVNHVDGGKNAKNGSNNILINSNFKCNFNIHREKLSNILNKKYGINADYDPCSYPGVKCTFYYNHLYGMDKELQQGQISKEDYGIPLDKLNKSTSYTRVSFMVFRTGSCLGSGKCSEEILRFAYEYIARILVDEYPNIVTTSQDAPDKKVRAKRRNIPISRDYLAKIISNS